MMSTIFKRMFIEEWRIHSTLLGNLSFGLLPIVILFFGVLSSIMANMLSDLLSTDALITVAHVAFLFFGMTVGGFGISGQEFMNRRFGQASLLSYSSRSLPISERRIFLNTVLKDIVYYTLIWIIPMISGFFIAEMFISSPGFSLFIGSSASLSLSFMMGLSLVFFLSTLYANSSVLFLIFISAVSVALTFNDVVREYSLMIFNPYSIIADQDISLLMITLSVMVVLLVFSILFIKSDFKENIVLYKNSYSHFSDFFSFTRFRSFIAKDYLDLRRSRGGLGKIFFSYAIPVIFIYLFVDFFRDNVAPMSFTLLFSLLLGVFSASIYTWITEHDLFMQYAFLPVDKKSVMKSKISMFSVMNIASYILLIVISIVRNELSFLIPSLIVFSIVSFFSLSLTIFLTGLLPSIRFMDAKVVVAYVSAIMPVVLSLIVTLEFFVSVSVILLAIIGFSSLFLMKRGMKRWNHVQDRIF